MTSAKLTLKMTSAQVAKMSVNVIPNSPSQDYTHPDNRISLSCKNNIILKLGKHLICHLLLKLFNSLFQCHFRIKPSLNGSSFSIVKQHFPL